MRTDPHAVTTVWSHVITIPRNRTSAGTHVSSEVDLAIFLATYVMTHVAKTTSNAWHHVMEFANVFHVSLTASTLSVLGSSN